MLGGRLGAAEEGEIDQKALYQLISHDCNGCHVCRRGFDWDPGNIAGQCRRAGNGSIPALLGGAFGDWRLA